MIEKKRKRLKLKGNKICKLISEYNFIQKLNFFCCKKDTFINTVNIINVNKMKSRGFFIKTFFSIFV